MLDKLGRLLAGYLEKPNASPPQPATCKPELVASAMRAGDVLLVDGSSRISTAIKYLTQSTWSHAALCIADDSASDSPDCKNILLLEADVLDGVRIINLSEYSHLHTRICRPVGLSADEVNAAIDFAKAKVGHQYDTKNILDLLRYLIQTPPVPTKWRRKMLALGSGDPTRAICSSLVAQAFHSVKYPILPDVQKQKAILPQAKQAVEEVLHIRHHTLFVPRDFDISPYFNIVKPTLTDQFDPHALNWAQYQGDEIAAEQR